MNWRKYTEKENWHEVANLFPLVSKEDLKALAKSIKENGLQNPVILLDGLVLDGRNRLLACDIADVTPDFKEWKGLKGLTPLMWVVTQNLERRHLDAGQKAFVAIEIERILAKEAKERQALSPGGKGSRLLTERIPEAIKGEAREQAAKIVGVNPHYVTDAKKIQEKSPALAKQVIAGTKTLPQAKRELKEQVREERREENKQKVVEAKTLIDFVKAEKKYATIVLDPPWDWGDEGDQDQLGRARPTYDTMSIEELKKLPVGKLADDDCHIYLWITNRSLPKGFDLLERWGFRYVTCLTWCKPSIGMGNYFRGSTEQILFGVKGSQMLKRKNAGTWFEAKRGSGHSSKPEEFYDLVESCSPGPYIELFSRKERKNWDVWGAEV